LLAPHRHAEPAHLFLRLARLPVIPAPVRSHRKVAHRFAAWQVTQFRIAAQIANNCQYLMHVTRSFLESGLIRNFTKEARLRALLCPFHPDWPQRMRPKRKGVRPLKRNQGNTCNGIDISMEAL